MLMKRFSPLLLAILLITACGERRVRGGGSDATEARPLTTFSGVEIAGSEAVEFLPATEARVEVTGYKNLLPHYKTGVEDGVLYLGFESEEDVRISNSNMRVKVYGPGFERINLSGSGSAVVLPGAPAALRQVSVAGSGSVTLRQAATGRLELRVSGSGDIHARQAPAGRVEATVSGSGDIETSPTTLLSATVSGSGNVHYWGTPEIEKTVAGSGDVIAGR